MIEATCISLRLSSIKKLRSYTQLTALLSGICQKVLAILTWFSFFSPLQCILNTPASSFFFNGDVALMNDCLIVYLWDVAQEISRLRKLCVIHIFRSFVRKMWPLGVSMIGACFTCKLCKWFLCNSLRIFFVFQDGVILGADTRATEGPIVADKNCEKIHYMAPNIYCCGAGTAADTEAVTGNLSLLFIYFRSQ